ncbi:hypothetical protein Tco_1417744 [Tanacetum coccineum]
MNQDFYNSNLSGFDQFQPPQFPVNYPPQETNKEILQAREDLMEAIEAFLKEYDHIPPNEKCMTLLLAEERFLKIKQVMKEEQNQPEVMQELLLKLMNDLQVLKGIQQEKEKPAAQSFTPYGNFSMIDDVEVLMKDIYTFLRKFSRISFGVTPKVILIAWERFGEIKHALTDKQYQQEDIQELMSKLLEDVRNISEELSEYINCPSWNRPTIFFDDDDEYTIIYSKPKAITPDLLTVEPDNSLSMGDEHLDTILSVENLVPIPSESKGISYDTCDMPVGEDSSTFDALSDHTKILSDSNNDGTSSDDDDFEDIEYVDASPHLSFLEFVILEEVIKDQEEKKFDLEDIFQIQDVILREKLVNISRLITNIESLKDNPSPDHVLKSPSLVPIPVREFESFHFDLYDDPSFPRPPPEPPDVEISLIVETDAPVINNFDELNEDDCFDPGGGVKTPFLTLTSPLRAGGISSGWNFHPGHLAARLGCAETKVATWDDIAFKLIILGWNVKHSILQNVDPCKDSLEKPKTVRPSAPIIEDWDTDSDNDSVFRPKPDQTKPKFTKINFVKSDENVKSVNKENTHMQEEYPRKSQSPRDNRRNWNRMMTQKLGNSFEFIKKACFVCGSFNHLIKDCDFHDKKIVEKPVLNNKGRVTGQREIRPVWNNAQRVNHQNKFTHPHPKRNFVPTTVVIKSGQVPVNAAKQSSPKAATSISTARLVNTAAPKSKGNPQYTLQDQGIFDSGCSRHMTGNKSFLTDYQEVDGGFVAFGGSLKGGKITRKGKIRTGKLNFEDVYFVKELKFNLFSVSQMCDKKNSVLFTKTECLVLSPDFKLLDESQVLLKVPRQNNMYSFNLKNVVLTGGLTCLFAKATIDESNLWHRRLGHVNFKL